MDSLAPSITNILVRGKLVTLGVFGSEEQVITKPLNPSAIGSMIYKLCLPVEPCEAVLQQELILILGKLYSTSPQLLDGILKVRVGYVTVRLHSATASVTLCMFVMNCLAGYLTPSTESIVDQYRTVKGFFLSIEKFCLSFQCDCIRQKLKYDCKNAR